MKSCRPVVPVSMATAEAVPICFNAPMKHIGASDALYMGGFALWELGIRVMVSASCFDGCRCGPFVNSCLIIFGETLVLE